MAISSDRDAFFAGLPSGEFTEIEQALRQALLQALQATPSAQPFPLMEWIQRRLGGEVSIMHGDTGLSEIQLQREDVEESASNTLKAKRTYEATFFASLPLDRFTSPELELRDAIFDFLARWHKTFLPSISSLLGDMELQKKRIAFLSKKVRLQEWIQRRIGSELEVVGDREEIHLSSAGRDIVKSKSKAPHQLGSAQPPIFQAQTGLPRAPRPQKLCKQFMFGDCPHGDSCTYFHPSDAHEVPACTSFVHKRYCKKGASCIYRHDTETCPEFIGQRASSAESGGRSGKLMRTR